MKKRIRESLLKKRDGIAPETRLQKDEAIETALLSHPLFKAADTILMYCSFRSEVNTMNYLQDILDMDKRLVLPVVDRRFGILRLFETRSPDELIKGYMGIPEPSIREGRQVMLSDIELVVIPGAGFDINGSRMGYGGGYYDRLLSHDMDTLSDAQERARRIRIIGLAFEEQIEDHIPTEPHDISIDIIITDKRVIQCRPSGPAG